MTSFSYADVSLDDLLLGIGGILLVATTAGTLFLINAAPGVIAAATTPFLLPREKPHFCDLEQMSNRRRE